MAQHGLYRLLVGVYLLLRVTTAGVNRLYVRQQAYHNLPMLIAQGVLLQGAGKALGNVHPTRAHKRRQVRHAPRGIVVAADGENGYPRLGKLGYERIKSGHRLALRRGALIHIPRNDNRVRAVFHSEGVKLIEYINLIFHQGNLVQPLSQMQIRRVKKFHPVPPPFFSPLPRKRTTARPAAAADAKHKAPAFVYPAIPAPCTAPLQKALPAPARAERCTQSTRTRIGTATG